MDPGKAIRPAWSAYSRLKSIGAGANGQVFSVQGHPEKGGVAGVHVVKRIFLQGGEDDLRQGANEIQLLRVLKHPNIVRYIDDFFDDEGYLNIVMENCEGGDLAQFIENAAKTNKPLSLKALVYFAFQLIQGVRYLHSRNIVHRDLKPNNIFLVTNTDPSSGPILKIADFGISRMLGPNSVAETVVGTPHYLSPEVCESAPYTNKADMWSLGVVMYELACLKKPFEGTNLLAVVRRITSGKWAPIEGGENEPLNDMLRRLLVVDPSKRATAYEMERLFFTSGLMPRPSEERDNRSKKEADSGGYDDDDFESEEEISHPRQSKHDGGGTPTRQHSTASQGEEYGDDFDD